MDSQPKFACLTDDLDRYNTAFETYERQAVSHGFKAWINQCLPDVAAELKKTFPSDEVRMLSVGGGTGRLDSKIVRQFLPHFSKITNTVIDPSKEAISTYQTMVADSNNQLSGITYDWNTMTLDEFKANQESNPARKFHFISAVHSLYYPDDPQMAVSYLYDLLEDGGKLLIVMQDEDSGIERIVRKFDLFDDATNQVDAFAAVRNQLKQLHIDYEKHMLPASYDVTPCYQDTEEGGLLLDFISHAANFKQTVSNQIQHDLLEYMRSEECSKVKGEQVLLDALEVALIVTK
ncbi:histamine N-methyltransferase-like isoform X2 [Amphiura filiformis]|uniref:histamine N-methyltransferase-like isoform X2 n=1 Tax=Amphiura filiformis TaxID=82378 RepID=UPI003B213675